MLTPHEDVKISAKTMYTAADLQDLRYSPVFSPTIAPNQTITFNFEVNESVTSNIKAVIYIKTLNEKYHDLGEYFDLNGLTKLESKIMELDDQIVVEYGIKFKAIESSQEFSFGSLNINAVEISGVPQYTIDFANQVMAGESVTPFSHNGGLHNLKSIEKQYKITNPMLEYCSLSGTTSITGCLTDQIKSIEYQLIPTYGSSHNMVFNAAGLERKQTFGFTGPNKVSIRLLTSEFNTQVVEIDYEWKHEECYCFKVVVSNDKVNYFINGLQVYSDAGNISYGLHGYYCDKDCAGYIRRVKVNYENEDLSII